MYLLDTWYINFPLDGTKPHRIPHVVTNTVGGPNAQMVSSVCFGASGTGECGWHQQFNGCCQHGLADAAAPKWRCGEHRLADAAAAQWGSSEHGLADAPTS